MSEEEKMSLRDIFEKVLESKMSKGLYIFFVDKIVEGPSSDIVAKLYIHDFKKYVRHIVRLSRMHTVFVGFSDAGHGLEIWAIIPALKIILKTHTSIQTIVKTSPGEIK